MRSTFAGFTTARLAMRASQKALDVTGQNIANINTHGYTRQRLDLISFNSGSGMDRYKSQYSVNIGNGVLATGVSQIRDPFLDIRFRNEIADVGGSEQKLDILRSIESIFDEVSKTGIHNQFGDLSTMLQKLSDDNTDDSMVRTSADVLVKMMNQYANQLETVKNDQLYNLESVDIPALNDVLENIKSLNENIKMNHLYGNNPLELIDDRNLLIDELASYMDIQIEMVKVPVTGDPNGRMIETLKVTHKQSGTVLIDDNHHATIGLDKSADGSLKIKITDANVPAGEKILTGDGFKSGILKSTLDMLNKKGDFDNPKTDVRGIGYYEESLNLLADKLAQTFNELNNIDQDHPDKYNLFESSDGGPITAKNIKISQAWLNNEIRINPAKDGSTTGKNDNILAMIDAIKDKKDYVSGGSNKIFSGTFQEYFTNIDSQLALDIKSTSALLDNHATVAQNISNMRDDVSRVQMDEEAIGILQYQKSYNAAARLMTALDEAVATIINNMGVVGR